jgi:cyclopropane-fatty-acyl-phospholipid synthase
MAFRYSAHVVFQIQLARRVDALPITRDYMSEAEKAMNSADRTSPPRYAKAS